MEEDLPKFENRSGLMLEGQAASAMRTAMAWAKFMAIVMFIFTGMMLVFSLCLLFMSGGIFADIMPYGIPTPGRVLGVIYLVICIVYFFLSFFMFMFSSKIKRAIEEGNGLYLEQGASNMRNYFMMSGIILIVGLAFTVLGFIMGIVGLATFM